MPICLHPSPAYPLKSPINQTDRLLAGSDDNLSQNMSGEDTASILQTFSQAHGVPTVYHLSTQEDGELSTA